ncbi:glycosyltransferase family 2 protein [uncultured Jatrophihabitans sp.]|uniref:glycosyltransferase family 2 protein n=1 Tax=uncultured Jatrophihabitans sp. TaxID=1610747 RepID=UPI0035CBBBC9
MDIVLPCLDEAAALPWVLDRIPPQARAIVVDNGSRDGSAQLARDRGALVVECGRRGYGAACHAGLEAATAEFVMFCDCDASLDPAVATQFVAALEAGADLVVGRRVPAERGAWSLSSRFANRELARRVRARTGLSLRDIGPVRAARRAPLLALPIADRRSGYPVETVLRAVQAGWAVQELDVAYLPRAGRSKVTGTLRGTVQAVRDMSAVLAS